MSRESITATIDSHPSREGAILLVGNYSNLTGYAWNNIYRLYDRIALEFKNKGCSVFLSFAEYQAPLLWDNADAIDGVFVLPPKPRGVRDLFRWVDVIRKHDIRFLYLTDQGGWSWVYGLFRLAGVKRILVHSRVSVPDPRPAAPETGLRGLLKWFLGSIALISATRIYAVSEFVRNRFVMKGRLPGNKVVTILNGVDLERFPPVAPRDTDEIIRIFCGARASFHKGVQVLIRAAAILRDHHELTNIRITYAGNGPDFVEFVRLADSLKLSDSFVFLGEVSTTESLVAGADIVVVPSIWGDACPSAISEALAAGKPLLATRVGGVPELVGDGGAALLVEPDDAVEMAEGIATLVRCKQKRSSLAKLARERAEAALDERRYHAQVIKQMINDCGFSEWINR